MARLVRNWFYGLLSLAGLLLLLTGFSPVLIEKFVLPSVLARAGLADYKFSISRLGLYGCTFHIGGHPQLSAPILSGNFTIEWTPAGLYQRRIDKISSNGLQINLANLRPRQKAASQLTGRDTPVPGPIHLPIIISQLEIDHGSLVFQKGKQTLYLPFTFSGQRVGDRDLRDPSGAVHFKAHVTTAENKIDATVTLHTLEGKLSSHLEGNFDLAALAPNLPEHSTHIRNLAGRVRVTGDITLQVTPFAVEKFYSSFAFDETQILGDIVSITTAEAHPAIITFTGDSSLYKINGTGLHLTHPLRTSLEFSTNINMEKNNLQWAGTVDLQLATEHLIFDELTLDTTWPLRIHHTGSRDLKKTSLHLATGIAESGSGASTISLQFKNFAATFAEHGIDTRITYPNQPGLSLPSAKFVMQLWNGTVSLPQGSMTVPKLGFQSVGTGFPGKKNSSVATYINLEDATLDLKKPQVRLEGIQLMLPLVWPLTDSVETGNLELESIEIAGKETGSISAEIAQVDKELAIKGSLATAFLPGDKIELLGKLRLPRKNNTYATLDYTLGNGAVEMQNFVSAFPALQGMTGSGTLDLQGNLSVSPCGVSGQTEISLQNGSLLLADADTELNDINFNIRFPALPRINSMPRQEFSIGTLRNKKVIINNVKTFLEIESPTSLFIEKISGQWSGGRVFTSSFRLQMGQEELEMALFCDRVELATILSQFGLAEAGGEGKLSGRIPLAYSSGNFYIDDGFLYSSPGEKGNLKIKKSKYLETAVPDGVTQFSPLHFAGAALADFEYNWAKLQVTSQDEDLLLKLQVDGKPRKKLPFRFDTEKNAFIRLQGEKKGGIDQPIKLDVNFNIPLNKMFRYKDKLMPLIKKFN